MERHLLRAACALLLLAPAFPSRAEPGAKPASQKPAPERSIQERAPPDKAGPTPVIGCPSLANYRLLMRRGGPAATAILADPKADHLGCTALPRGRITGVADRVALGGRSYDCASVQGTSACHWIEAGTMPAAR